MSQTLRYHRGKDQKLKCFVFQFLIKITTILSQIICIRCESERTQSAGQVQRFQKSVKQRIKYSISIKYFASVCEEASLGRLWWLKTCRRSLFSDSCPFLTHTSITVSSKYFWMWQDYKLYLKS